MRQITLLLLGSFILVGCGSYSPKNNLTKRQSEMVNWIKNNEEGRQKNKKEFQSWLKENDEARARNKAEFNR